MYTLTLESVEHNEEYLSEYLRVIRGSVVMEVLEIVVLCYDVELMLFELGVYVARETYGIEISVFKGNAVSVCGNSDKAYVKVGIVRDKKRVTRKGEEFLYSLPLLYLSCHHLVGDRGQLCDLLGYRLLGIDEEVESVEYLAVLYLDSTDFYYLTVSVGKTCGLYIKDNHLVLKCGVLGTENASCGIVYVIRLNTVEDLKTVVLSRLTRSVEREHNFGECLHVTVVGYGYRLVSPSYSGINELLRSNDSIHLRHIGVQVELNALFLSIVESEFT